MKTLHSGAAPASPLVARVVERLLAAYAGPLRLLTGLRLPEPNTGQSLALDLVAVTDHAIVVGVEIRPESPQSPPQAAALAVARLQREKLGEAPLPVYAFWLGAAVPAGYTGGAPALADPDGVLRFVEHASGQQAAAHAEPAGRLAEALRQADLGLVRNPPPAPAKPTLAAPPPPEKRPNGGVLRRLRDLPGQLDAGLRDRLRQPLPLRREVARPADVQRRLEAAMLDPDHILEDARYSKIVPNEYIVELDPDNHERHYAQIEQRVCEQWQVKLLEALDTANQRQGRRVYHFGGPVRVSLRPGAGLAPGAVRIRSRIVPASAAPPKPAGCLQLMPNGRQWPLLPGTLTLGRHETSDIYLETPPGPQPPLISAHHAYLLVTESEVRLFDGSPAGRPSLNGTFVNGQRVPSSGQALQPGDVVVLAPLNPKDPRPAGPGVLALQFHERCPHE
jgi:hypothetical protein